MDPVLIADFRSMATFVTQSVTRVTIVTQSAIIVAIVTQSSVSLLKAAQHRLPLHMLLGEV